MNPRQVIKALTFLIFGTVGFQAAAELVVENATVRLLPPGVPNTSAYFTIKNTGENPRFLVAAKTDFANSAELHAHVMEGDVMRMQEQAQVKIDAGETLYFQPGGLHVMIFGLQQSLQENQQVAVTLVTKNSQQLTFKANVVMPGDEGGKHSHHHH